MSTVNSNGNGGQLKRGEVDEICEEVEKAIAAKDANRARWKLGRAVSLCRRVGRFEEGIALFRKARRELGDDAMSEQAFNAVAAAYADSGDRSRARRYAHLAVKANGGEVSPYTENLLKRVGYLERVA